MSLPTSPAADRNKQPILEVLLGLLPQQGRALEIAAGTGQHAAHFSAALPGWSWQPTDADADALPAIAAWTHSLGNVEPPVHLDVIHGAWPGTGYDLVYCANMLHIPPWATCTALMQGAGRVLSARGLLVVYGPFLEEDVPTAPGNAAFDASLRARDARWGIRRREDVTAEAAGAGLVLHQRHAMPANNLLLVFRRATAPLS